MPLESGAAARYFLARRHPQLGVDVTVYYAGYDTSGRTRPWPWRETLDRPAAARFLRAEDAARRAEDSGVEWVLLTEEF